MHAQIDELFEFAGIVLARVRVAPPVPDDQTWCCRLEQNGIVLSADHRRWFEIVSPPVVEPKGGPNRRRVITVRRAQRPEAVYLVAFADEACLQLSHNGSVTVMVQAGQAEIGQQSLTMSALTVARLEDPGFKAALGAAVQAAGVPAVAAVLNASIQVEALEQFDHVEFQHAIFANAGLVLNGWIRDFARRDIHLVTADLRSWAPPSLIASHARHIDGALPATKTEGEAPSPTGLDFTAVLRVAAAQATQEIYLVEIDPSGMEAVFYGPLTIRGGSGEPQALQLIKDAFGPIQSLPKPLVQHVYRPVLARPKTSARARRFTFGPPIDEAAPLASIIIPFYGDAFFLNCVSHLQRVLGSGFELILVVDDPRIWPTVYGHLSARRSSITVPTVVLECEDNYGYARANNLGFMAARGDVLFLMNSDILVLDAAALEQAAAVIRARRQAREPEAIIGFSLRFEDDTLQHIGMEFPRSPLVGDMRLADHPLKGMPSALYDGEAVRRVTAVTGALMALSSALYQTLGGFDAAYERGDFEDADLCLRARQIGAEVWVHVTPGLYHLERQSIRAMGDNHLRETITYLNCLTFNARWDAHLSEGALDRSDAPARSTTGRRPISVRKRHTLQAAPHQPAQAGAE
jgi:GT2 family glycosyltransferase